MLSHITAWTQGRPLLSALRNSGRFLTIPFTALVTWFISTSSAQKKSCVQSSFCDLSWQWCQLAFCRRLYKNTCINLILQSVYTREQKKCTDTRAQQPAKSNWLHCQHLNHTDYILLLPNINNRPILSKFRSVFSYVFSELFSFMYCSLGMKHDNIPKPKFIIICILFLKPLHNYGTRYNIVEKWKGHYIPKLYIQLQGFLPSLPTITVELPIWTSPVWFIFLDILVSSNDFSPPNVAIEGHKFLEFTRVFDRPY